MHSWPVIVALSIFSFIIGFILLHRSKSNKGRALIFFLSSYGIISSMIMVLILTFWHFHPVWGEWLHRHPNSGLTEITLIHLGLARIDLFSILVVLATALFYLVAIGYSQLKLYQLHRKLVSQNLVECSQALKSEFEFLKDIELLVIDNQQPVAFSFTRILSPYPVNIQDSLVLSTGLMQLLTRSELKAVLAHEYAHCIDNDTRYAHLLVTLRSLFRVDPMLKYLERKLNYHQELAADDRAVEMTNQPKSLAMALFKLIEFEFDQRNPVKLLISGSKQIIFFRIKRLLQMSYTEPSTPQDLPRHYPTVGK